MKHSITLQPEYAYVLLANFALVVVYFLIGGFGVGTARRKTFTKDFMEKHFSEEHKKHFGSAAPKGGYPDMGNGRYSERLSYEQWFHFNNAQRVHYNFLEQLPVVIVCSAIGGLFYPIYSALATGVFLVGRILYSLGYYFGGPKARIPGGILGTIGDVMLIGLAGYGSVTAVLKL